nr:SHOCT domain-containing protein [Thermoleophilaceae bacterium]
SIDAAGASGVDVNELQKMLPGAQIDVTTESWNAMQGGGSLSEQIKAAMEVAQQYQQAAGQIQTPGMPDTASTASAGSGPEDEVDDTLSQLEKLVALRDGGVLTDAEFETAKQKILGDI